MTRRGRWARCNGLLIALSATFAGCAAPKPDYSVRSADPTEKIPAIKIAVRNHDLSALPDLVKDLDSDDPAVRFYANDGLQKLTGEHFGYLYYADDQAREPAEQRWKAWLAAHHPTSAPHHAGR